MFHSINLNLAGAVLLSLICLVLLVLLIEPNPPTYKIEFLADDEIYTIHTDQDGIVKSSSDHDMWIDCVIVNVRNISIGDTMMMYDLYSNVLHPVEYKVLKIGTE